MLRSTTTRRLRVINHAMCHRRQAVPFAGCNWASRPLISLSRLWDASPLRGCSFGPCRNITLRGPPSNGTTQCYHLYLPVYVLGVEINVIPRSSVRTVYPFFGTFSTNESSDAARSTLRSRDLLEHVPHCSIFVDPYSISHILPASLLTVAYIFHFRRRGLFFGFTVGKRNARGDFSRVALLCWQLLHAPSLSLICHV
ncbi:hypothetical protein F5148DRAFT_1190107 [Russula earlei]|uniref:Uncharacterized protein n=1 Tax=Russula earlei TaxID=71964 RepID=A0ACC0UBH0_9AGAM|nr:hypothetical protein F5148DRAFT_1190107 [Russula earlei]